MLPKVAVKIFTKNFIFQTFLIIRNKKFLPQFFSVATEGLRSKTHMNQTIFQS